MRIQPALPTLLVLVFAAGLAAQTAAAPAAPAPAAPTAANPNPAPANARPSLAGPPPPQLVAARNLVMEMQNAKLEPTRISQDIDAFAAQHPHNPYLGGVYFLAMQYFRQRSLFAQEIGYGERVLQREPHQLVALMQLATVIPMVVRPSDLNRDQMLNNAASYARRAMAEVAKLKPGMGKPPMTAAQVAGWQKLIHATAESAFGRIDSVRGQSAKAIGYFQQAVALETGISAANDYFRMGLEQAKLHQYSEALASLHKAAALAPQDAGLQTQLRAEMGAVRRSMQPPPAAPTQPPAAPATAHSAPTTPH